MVKSNDLTKGPVVGKMISLTAPMVLGMFSMMAFNLVDAFFVSRLGTRHLAAMTFTFPVVMVVISIALGLGTGAASLISRVIGQGDIKRVQRITTDSVILALVLGAAFSAIGLLSMRYVFKAMGATPGMYRLIREYMTVWYLGVGFIVVPITGNNAIRASGDTFLPGMVMAVASVLNAVLDPVMIFGLFGFPRLELAGAALATVTSRALTLIFAIYVLHFKKRMLSSVIPAFREMMHSCRELLYVGLPASMTNILFAVTTGVITRIISVYGPGAVAAVGVGTRIESLVLMLYFSMMTALVPFFGQNWGAGEIERVHEAQRKSMIFSVVYGALAFFFFLLAGRSLGGIFSREPYVVTGIYTFLVLNSFGYGARGTCMISIAMLNAVNMPIRATVLNLIRMFLLYIPLAYTGSRLLGYKGVFIGITAGNFIAAAVTLFWLKNICMRCEMENYFSRR
ncbi:MAG: MATE family efflux transporter [Candidatus Omnitrophica bacterium]|nr:MATE family efflux transporter [Candidatus Omnitrophota bacterium]